MGANIKILIHFHDVYILKPHYKRSYIMQSNIPIHFVLASNNPGKLREFKDYFAQQNTWTLHGMNGLEMPEETGLSFIENAIAKARYASMHFHMPALADDSGLCIPALGDQPGIYSARWAQKHGYQHAQTKDMQENIDLLCQQLAGQLPTPAYYFIALAWVRHAQDPHPIIATGRMDALFMQHAQGEGGFGYDAHMHLPERNTRVAQLSLAEKQSISHRGQALQALFKQFKN